MKRKSRTPGCGSLLFLVVIHMRQRERDALVDEFVSADVTCGSLGIDLRQNLRGDPHGDHFFLRFSG